MRLAPCDPTCTPYALFQKPACPRCGEMLFAAAGTQFLGGGKICNSWSCDSCDHAFSTSVALPNED